MPRSTDSMTYPQTLFMSWYYPLMTVLLFLPWSPCQALTVSSGLFVALLAAFIKGAAVFGLRRVFFDYCRIVHTPQDRYILCLGLSVALVIGAVQFCLPLSLENLFTDMVSLTGLPLALGFLLFFHDLFAYHIVHQASWMNAGT